MRSMQADVSQGQLFLQILRARVRSLFSHNRSPLLDIQIYEQFNIEHEQHLTLLLIMSVTITCALTFA